MKSSVIPPTMPLSYPPPPYPSDYSPPDPKLPPPRYHHLQPPPRDLPHMAKVHRYPQYVRKDMPLPMHPDPNFSQHDEHHERSFFARHQPFFDDLSHEEVALPPPNHPDEHANTLAGVDTIAPHHLSMPTVPTISSLPLPGISTQPPQYTTSTGLGNAAIVGGASEIAEALVDRKTHYRRLRTVPRARSQQMTESQRKQRHNEHTRASRSRIDKGLERLKSVIRKVRPHQKVTKKADVLQEAVKLLKEGFRLPATESDEERDDQPESTLTV